MSCMRGSLNAQACNRRKEKNKGSAVNPALKITLKHYVSMYTVSQKKGAFLVLLELWQKEATSQQKT